MATISVYRDRYPTSFVVPRESRHRVKPRLFLPSDKIAEKYRGLSLYLDWPRPALMHAWNRIPIGNPKYVISFESSLPQNTSQKQNSKLHKFMMRQLASNRCRRLIGLSHYAENLFYLRNRDHPLFDTLREKLFVRYPNVLIPHSRDVLEETLENAKVAPLVLTFVGAHFARKGGCVAVRVAEEASKLGLPVHVNIVSSLTVGANVWTDPANDDFFDPYRKGLEQSNISFRQSLPNLEVLKLLASSHFSLLPSFSDTFGYSIIEGMAHHTPAIATDVQAIPEFVRNDFNGILLEVDKKDTREWASPPYSERHTPAYETFFKDEVEKLVSQLMPRLEWYINRPQELLKLRKMARLTAETMFSPKVSSDFYDPFYERVVTEKRSDVPICDKALDISSPDIAQAIPNA